MYHSYCAHLIACFVNVCLKSHENGGIWVLV